MLLQLIVVMQMDFVYFFKLIFEIIFTYYPHFKAGIIQLNKFDTSGL